MRDVTRQGNLQNGAAANDANAVNPNHINDSRLQSVASNRTSADENMRTAILNAMRFKKSSPLLLS